MTILEHKVKTFSPINKLMDDGIQKELDLETKVWNERLYQKKPYKGGELDRFPLSPSQIGKCSLALARNLSHYLGISDYPRSPTGISTRVKRIFSRGHLLEGALIQDLEKYTPLKIEEQQTRLKLFPLTDKLFVEGNIDGLAVHEEEGVKILIDFKSKGAFYSAGFTDSISQFFQELRQTGLVEEIHENCFLITNAKGLFDIIDLGEFFVDYLLQLNAYAFGLRDKGTKVDFVSLYYENKNTSANYEVRWVPSVALFDYAKAKFQFIYNAVETQNNGPRNDESLMAAVPKDFNLGSARCRLCEYNELCWGKYEPKNDAQKGKLFGVLTEEMDNSIRAAIASETLSDKIKEQVLLEMAVQDVTHIKLGNGLTYTRKWLKSKGPAGSFELRLVK